MKTFVSYKEAGNIIARAIKPLTSQEVDLLAALNCVLAQDVVSQINLPACDNSAMDGYAVRHQDIQAANLVDPVKLKIIGSVFAGQAPRIILKDNQAIRIMTGAAIPKGADTVVPVEQTREKNGSVFIRESFARGTNARFMGEDIRKGELVLKQGILLRSAEIALLAALGYAKLKVIKTPQVAILATGDELVGLNEKLRPGKIRNSNSYSLAAAVMESQAKPVLLGIAKDDFQALKARIKQGLAYDMLLISGGISMGRSDFVGSAIKDLGVKIKFTKVLQRPGQPLTFGLYRSKPVFCLPGNPVSTLMSFEMHVRPALFKMMKRNDLARQKVTAYIQDDIRVKPGRTYFLRVRLSRRKGRYYARLTGPQGSGIMKSMVLANGILVVPEKVDFIKKAERWPVILL